MKYINLLILTIFGNIRQILPAALLPGNTISLYNENDKITILGNQNFSSIVYQSKTAWLVEFYASWCGHCQSYAKIYREVAIDAWTWKSIIRIGAINCYAVDNHELCRQHNVPGYPTLRLIPPETAFTNTTKSIDIPATDAIYVEREVIKELDSMHKRYTLWPYLTPVTRITFEELYARSPSTTKLLLVIVERRDDYTGRQIMLDFSKYREQLAIFRTTTDGKLWHKFHIDLKDIPAVFVILRNRTAQRIYTKQNISNNIDKRDVFNNAIRSYIHETKSIDNFNDEEFEEIILSKNKLKNIETRQTIIQNKNITDDIADKHTIHRKVSMVDLESALSYMIYEEIPQKKEIHGEIYDALVNWLNVLTKYFPGREPIMNYLKQLLSKVNQQSTGFSGNVFRDITDMKTSNGYLPNDYNQYEHCAGSTSQYRGYPCALWLLFHTLTVSQYQKESQEFNIKEVLSPIKNYVKYFFSCRQCSENFMKETINIDQLNSKNKHDAIIYLWIVHNNVNKRLHGDLTEDPKHPKVQFPSKYLCGTCQPMNNNEYDVSNIVSFLIEYYSKENIDKSLILKKSYDHKDLVISKIKYNQLSTQYGLLQYFNIIIQRFQLYILIVFIIITVILRRRYCREKNRRYTV